MVALTEEPFVLVSGRRGVHGGQKDDDDEQDRKSQSEKKNNYIKLMVACSVE